MNILRNSKVDFMYFGKFSKFIVDHNVLNYQKPSENLINSNTNESLRKFE